MIGTVRRPGRIAGALLAASVAAGLLAAGPDVGRAAAADVVPVWTYLAGDARPAPSGPWGDALRTGALGNLALDGYLTPAGVSPTTYDVSADGSTLAFAGTSRGADQWSAPYTVSPTQGLVVVRRESGSVTSRVVATDWSLGPVLSADGSRLWWTYRGVVYRYQSGVTTRLSASLFAPRTGETMTAFSVSPDGTKGAALYWSAAGARVLAADFVAGRTMPYLEHRFPRSDGPLAPDCFTWLDDAQVLLRPTATPRLVSSYALGANGLGGWSTWSDTAGWYRPRLIGSQWWIWDRTPLPNAAAWAYRALATPLVAGADPVASGLTQLYASVAATPPAVSVVSPPPLGATADVRATGAGHLTLSATSIVDGTRAFDIAYGQYLTALPGQTLSGSGRTLAGRLEYSYDSTTWHVLRWNSLPILTPWPGTRSVTANGYVTVRRSVWVRYRYSGDPFVEPLVSPVRRLTVTPRLWVRVTLSASGRSRLLAGSVTRVGGAALLYRYAAGAYVIIGRTTVSSSGRYSFGWRVLPHGYYKIASVADADWNSGRLLFAL